MTYVSVDAAGTAGLAVNTQYDYAVATTATGLNLTFNGITAMFTDKRPASNPALDGTWVGLNQGYYETIEFNQGLYRIYRLAGPQGAQALMGVFNFLNATHIQIRYGFTPQIPDIKNAVFDIPFTLSGDGLTLTLVIQGVLTINYNKAVAPPAFRRIIVRLDASFDSWNANKTAKYIRDMANFLQVSVCQIEVQSVSAGSVVLDAVLIDDQQNGKTAAMQFAALQSANSIGGFGVTVTDYANRNSASGIVPSLFILALLSTLLSTLT
jgi:hypothetical protein